jgi:hypothetical protein
MSEIDDRRECKSFQGRQSLRNETSTFYLSTCRMACELSANCTSWTHSSYPTGNAEANRKRGIVVVRQCLQLCDEPQHTSPIQDAPENPAFSLDWLETVCKTGSTIVNDRFVISTRICGWQKHQYMLKKRIKPVALSQVSQNMSFPWMSVNRKLK